MKEPSRVVRFVAWSTGILLITSILARFFGFAWMPLERVNLISDLVHDVPSTDTAHQLNTTDSIRRSAQSSTQTFEQYHLPARIIQFQSDTTQPAIPQFLAKLYQLRTTKKGKIRIAYFGDSMIEGDLMTQTFRQFLQTEFGGGGVGFVPITSIVSQFRQSVRSDYSNGWSDRNLKESSGGTPLYLSGHAFSSTSDWARFTDQTLIDSAFLLQKFILCAGSNNASLLVNGKETTLPTAGSFHKVLVGSEASRTITITATAQTPVLYGVSFETANGVILDNFSFRGISGTEFSKLSAEWLQQISAEQPYDLIVFQYGVNLLFRPMEKNFRPYGRAMLPIVQRFKKSFPGADILVVSTADRAFRYQGKMATAVGMDSLINVQAQVAFDSKSAFFNLYETMGGANSIIEWANRAPSWANRDYIHPNSRGAAWLGETMFRAIQKEYELYVRSLKTESNKINSTP